MATIFSRIITGEIPSYKVAENDQFYAFLYIFQAEGRGFEPRLPLSFLAVIAQW